LLAANGVTESDAKLVHIPTHRSRLAVQTGEVDVALMVGGVRTVIKCNWKLVKIALLPGKTELFDLSVDPGEKNDIAAQNPEVVRDLDARLVAYAKQQKMSEWLKAQPDYLGAQGKTVFDPDFDIDDGGLPQMKTVLPKK
jgi:hypothetical protein